MQFLLTLVLVAAPQETPLPRVEIREEGQIVTTSCRLVFPANPLPDAGSPGAIVIRGDGLTIECEGTLAGAAHETPWNELEGVGLRIEGSQITVLGGAVRGYRVGIQVEDQQDVVLRGWDVSDNFRQRLFSTPEREDERDWLRPHENRNDEWVTNYGAGIHAKNVATLTVENCRARRIQNGVVLDSVARGILVDNDFSYLSGWGIALWFTNETRIERNRLDFCVRGYSNGVYNRGQDSAGVLAFEQCHRNTVIDNSITHCGDGIFAHSGSMALGEHPAPGDRYSYLTRGNARNQYHRNDLSFAVAHGLETTFSFDVSVIQNLLEGNAITGLWGGYSTRLKISGNRFLANGDRGYGQERGGINIEHGKQNRILGNEFRDNEVGVRLWWDEDAGLASLPWVTANGAASEFNVIDSNRFRGDGIGIELQAAGPTHVDGNRFRSVGTEVKRDESSLDWDDNELNRLRIPTAPARAHGVPVRGREHIVIGAFGPWDGEEPLVVDVGRARWRAYLPRKGGRFGQIARIDGGQESRLEADGSFAIRLNEGAAVVPYAFELDYWAPDAKEPTVLRGTGLAQRISWSVRCFPTTADPRDDRASWEAAAAEAQPVELASLELDFGSGSPYETYPGFELESRDRFGTLAQANFTLPRGRWRLSSRSDDGIRVLLNGQPVIEDWTHHAPRSHQYEWSHDDSRPIELVVEHFELDGHATLVLELSPIVE